MLQKLRVWAALAFWAPELLLSLVVQRVRTTRPVPGRITRVGGIELPLAPSLPREGAFLEYLTQIGCGTYEPCAIHLVRKLLPRGGVFFDVGANIGYFSAVAAARVGPRGQVHAFDVDPRCVENLRALKARNPRYDIRPVHAAVGASSEPVQFEPRANCTWASLRDATGGKGSGERVTVAGITLSEYILRGNAAAPHLLKIDVEGFEHDVLRGLRPYLERGTRRPPILMEIAGDSSSLRDLIVALGYDICSTVPPFRSARSSGRVSNVLLVPSGR